MATRSDYLAILNGLDTPTLEKLAKFSGKMMVPDEDTLIRVQFTDLIDKAHELATTYFPEWTDQTKADFGEYLVEFMSLAAYRDFWYINAFLGEAFQQTAKMYLSIVLHALRLGYTPVFTKSSQVTLALTFNPVLVAFTINPGDIIFSYPNSDLVFSNRNSINVPINAAYTVSITGYSGRITNANTLFNGKSIRIPAKNVDPASIVLYIKGILWQHVDTFAASTNSSTHYEVLPTDGNEFECGFGQGGFGLRPQVGDAINISYQVDTSESPNVGIAALTIEKNTSNNDLASVIMSTTAAGGARAESMDSIRYNSSMLFRTKSKTAINNPQSLKIVLEADPLVFRAVSFNVGRIFYFACIPADGSTADNTFLNALITVYRPYVLTGFILSGAPTAYVAITGIAIDVYMYNEFVTDDGTAAKASVKAYLSYITDPLQGAGYGVGLDLGQLVLELKESIPGLNNAIVTSINGGSPVNIVLSPLQIFSAIDLTTAAINIIKV